MAHLGRLLHLGDVHLDELVVERGLLVEDSDGHFLPGLFLFVDLELEFVESTLLAVLLNLLELHLDLGEGSDGVVDEEVVHHIGVVSLERNSIRSDDNGLDSLNLLDLVVLLIWFL